ncbi:hypothetical protein [Ramlibacter humi]|uniref:DUF4148 domain-containing protein n=1 Tax=Ramlibacter humi TaxID=2530451 RepID=A0A4Z0BU21_9BURK|nr:hypothetical protein [Ramlibacter humi]TFZ01900.1 hypothetical protein EZ216_11970 [Ramlibacter humi]
MKMQQARPLAVMALTAGLAGGAMAQPATPAVPADSDAPPSSPGQVMSDVQPLPAEVRDSHGAIVLDQSKVRAQRQRNDFQAAGDRTGVTSTIGRNVSRIVERSRSWSDLREAEAPPPDGGR